MKVGVSIYLFGGGWLRAAWDCWLGEDPLCVLMVLHVLEEDVRQR